MFWGVLYIRSDKRNRMEQLLYKYLVLKGRLELPELGRLQLRRYAASLQAAQLKAPRYEIEFESSDVHPPRDLYNFLAAEQQTDDLTSIASFNEWLAAFKQSLRSGTAIQWEHLGSFSMDANGVVQFMASPMYIQGPVFNLAGQSFESTHQDEEELEEERPDQYWWIYAIILFLLGGAAIAYRYL